MLHRWSYDYYHLQKTKAYDDETNTFFVNHESNLFQKLDEYIVSILEGSNQLDERFNKSSNLGTMISQIAVIISFIWLK